MLLSKPGTEANTIFQDQMIEKKQPRLWKELRTIKLSLEDAKQRNPQSSTYFLETQKNIKF